MVDARAAPPRPPPVAIMPSVEIANMPPNSHDVGLRTPRTTMKPNDPASITSGSNRISMPPGTTFSGSGGAWSASSLAGGVAARGGAVRPRRCP